MVETRDSERLQPASAMRRASASRGDLSAGVSAWISNWLSAFVRPAACEAVEGDFEEIHLWAAFRPMRKHQVTPIELTCPCCERHMRGLPLQRNRFVDIRGSICALVTPFAADDSLDLAAFGRLIEQQADGGTQALVVAGSTGEAHMLETDEFDRLLAFALLSGWLVACR
ncbi:4-hydroxy-tetrahydrodipicolinate synthase [Rhodanobacter lindaniclasticus]